jgi:hypothetical protein
MQMRSGRKQSGRDRGRARPNWLLGGYLAPVFLISAFTPAQKFRIATLDCYADYVITDYTTETILPVMRHHDPRYFANGVLTPTTGPRWMLYPSLATSLASI